MDNLYYDLDRKGARNAVNESILYKYIRCDRSEVFEICQTFQTERVNL